MYTGAVAMVTGLTIHMVIILLVVVTMVAHNHHLMDSPIMPINISPIVHGWLVVTEHSTATVVLEDVKASSS